MQIELILNGIKISLSIESKIGETIHCKDIVNKLVIPVLQGAGYPPSIVYDALNSAIVPGVEYITTAPSKK